MAARSRSDDAEGRRPPARANEKGVVDLAGDAMTEIATLVQTELQLLRAEISEKLTFTALSAALIGGGALLLMATIVLLLQVAVTGLVADGFSWPVATPIVAAVTLVVGAGLIWLGINRLSLVRLAPSKTRPTAKRLKHRYEVTLWLLRRSWNARQNGHANAFPTGLPTCALRSLQRRS